MSVEIGKIIEVYEQSLSILQAKNQLFIEQKKTTQQNKNNNTITSRNSNQPTKSTTTTSKGGQKYGDQYQQCTHFINASLKGILKLWAEKYILFTGFKNNNKGSIRELNTKLSDLKNNTQLLTKQEQLISKMQDTIRQWSQIIDPQVYYDIKKRQSLKSDLLDKISQAKQTSALTKKSATPLYTRKIHQQLKSTIYSVYIAQNELDRTVRNKNLYEWQKTVDYIYEEDRKMRTAGFYNYIGDQCESFFGVFGELFLRNGGGRISEDVFLKYNQELSGIAKNIGRFWESYASSLDNVLATVTGNARLMQQSKEDFMIKQNNIITLLQKPNTTISKIFKIDTSIKSITSLTKLFQILPILSRFQTTLQALRTQILSHLNSCQQYRNRLVQNIQSRYKQFYLYGIDDKNFLDANSKSQIGIRRKFVETYAKFVGELYRIAKDNLEIFRKEGKQVYEEYEIGAMLARQIIAVPERTNQQQNISMISTSNSGLNNSKNSTNTGPKTTKNQKLIQCQLFCKSIQVFDPSNINWNRNNIFSCALGPRFLLHGTMAALDQGVYFQSYFNKKNLFFGKTRYFVPRSQILQICIQNTLIIFPDAVQLKTKKGSLFFHALGNRQTISNTLNQIYFPQSAGGGEGDGQASEADFCEYKEGQWQRQFGEKEVEELVKKHENVFVDRVFKGIGLKKFYRRYWSGDKFQFRGNQYQNFRTYFLQQIQVIDPKSTPITPQHPSYLNYPTQPPSSNHNPKISQRYHTYKKTIPKIPFLSSGGLGLCQDRQVYSWISPELIVIDCVSTVKGFSLIETMEIHTRYILKQEVDGVGVSISSMVKFGVEASSNGLVKGPAISNLKDSVEKMVDIIEKYQKAKQNRKKGKGDTKAEDTQQIYEENMGKLRQQNQKLKFRFKASVATFVLIYVMTLVIIRMLYF